MQHGTRRGVRTFAAEGEAIPCPSGLDRTFPLHVSSHLVTVSSATQTECPTLSRHIDSPLVAETSLVPDVIADVQAHLQTSAIKPGPTVPCAERGPPSRLTQSGPDGMVHNSVTFSHRVSNVLLNSIKQSTRNSYAAKWSRFCAWLGPSQLSPTEVGLARVFDFLISLKDLGLSHSSLRVYLAALSAFHSPVEIFKGDVTRLPHC